MSVYEVVDKKIIADLFDGWEETLIWSCLDGSMGRAYVTDLEEVVSAQIITGDFCFLAGVPSDELVLNRNAGAEADFIIMVPQSDEWAKSIERVYGEKAHLRMRYAIKKEPDVFNREYLQMIVDCVDQQYHLERIDKKLYIQTMKMDWSKDLCAQFNSADDYMNRGIGIVAMLGDRIISGASSYTIYKEGIEIEIDTREDHRRKGLALACGARLILECLELGLYPSWDAQNKASVALAEKLGYHFDKEYPVYEIFD